MSITVGSSTITVNSGAVMADPPGTAGLFFARAWVNFNGTGTVAIRASGGVSSISDVAQGDYTINMSSAAQTDANYACVALNSPAADWQFAMHLQIAAVRNNVSFPSPTTTAMSICSLHTGTGNAYDVSHIHAVILR